MKQKVIQTTTPRERQAALDTMKVLGHMFKTGQKFSDEQLASILEIAQFAGRRYVNWAKLCKRFGIRATVDADDFAKRLRDENAKR